MKSNDSQKEIIKEILRLKKLLQSAKVLLRIQKLQQLL
jgi:hypothetical protein|tara:strand:- start:971 stop:1084 length:114 start_codon:yes stop_codon:yes gene_type:complete